MPATHSLALRSEGHGCQWVLSVGGLKDWPALRGGWIIDTDLEEDGGITIVPLLCVAPLAPLHLHFPSSAV